MTEGAALRDIVSALMRLPSPTALDLGRVKMHAAAKHRLENIPSNSQIIASLTTSEKRKLLPLLRRKTTRTISGVTVVAVMTKPYPCPQPEPCAYCPGGPRLGTPQSYTGFEPAAMRGSQNRYDPYRQVRRRIEQLRDIGHSVDKIELIIMGGTFPATPLRYQKRFIQRCLDAITNRKSGSLQQAKRNAETSRIRNVGITVETRPDWAKQPQIDRMLDMGVTRIELGVQCPSNDVYGLVGRTHTVEDVKEATQTAKDAGLKLVYHIMPGLPGSNLNMDLKAFSEVFSSAAFKPDMLKIYPCLVLKDTRTHDWYLNGTYKPYTTDEAVQLIAEIKKTIPVWMRVMRVQRDIPAQLIIAGVNKSNLRQLVQQRLKMEGSRCRCIRCREVGHRLMTDGVRPNPGNIQISSLEYEASEGREIFISAEDHENDVLLGYLRLRIPSEKAHRPEITTEPTSIVRELHVYGPLVPVGKHLAKAWQHKGLGASLLGEAERISREEYGLNRVLVISALGTKEYYKRFGYRHDGVYVSKSLGNHG